MKHKFTTILTTAFALVFTLLIGAGNAWGQTYTFSSKSWADATNSWTSNKDGYQYNNNNSGTSNVQVTSGCSEAGATSKSSFSNITSITVNAATTSKGVGNITIKVGDGEAQTICSLSKNQTFTDYTLNYNSPVNGTVTFVVNCSTNSMYLHSITVTCAAPSTGVSAPTFSPAAGFYFEAQNVTLSQEDE